MPNKPYVTDAELGTSLDQRRSLDIAREVYNRTAAYPMEELRAATDRIIAGLMGYSQNGKLDFGQLDPASPDTAKAKILNARMATQIAYETPHLKLAREALASLYANAKIKAKGKAMEVDSKNNYFDMVIARLYDLKMSPATFMPVKPNEDIYTTKLREKLCEVLKSYSAERNQTKLDAAGEAFEKLRQGEWEKLDTNRQWVRDGAPSRCDLVNELVTYMRKTPYRDTAILVKHGAPDANTKKLMAELNTVIKVMDELDAEVTKHRQSGKDITPSMVAAAQKAANPQYVPPSAPLASMPVAPATPARPKTLEASFKSPK